MFRLKSFTVTVTLALAAISITSANTISKTRTISWTNKHESSLSMSKLQTTSLDSILLTRGGASKKRKNRKAQTATLHSTSSSSKPTKKTATGKRSVGSDKPNATASTIEKYKSILPITRIYITLIGIVTAISLAVGEEATQVFLALDPIRTFNGFEFWRPFTAAAFLGPPSIGWLMNAYYLFEYGSSLEKAFGTPQHIIFVFSQLCILTMLSVILQQPFFGSSMITAMLHVLSRMMPNQKVKWLIFPVPYWSLPYGLMASDILQQSSIMSALPHIIGILSGHFYYFHKFVWTKLGGEDWLVAPNFLENKFDPDIKKAKLNEALKAKRKRRKGRKLGA